MKILAIDPGTRESALCWLTNGKVAETAFLPNGECLPAISGFYGGLIACEMIASYGMPVGKETFDTVLWIGRFCEAAMLSKHRFELLYRKDIKMHLCGSMRAKDANIRQALLDRYGPQGTKKAPGPTYGLKSHAWAALAVATLAHDKFKEETK